jgi:membrane-associated phospholipid phosphatase
MKANLVLVAVLAATPVTSQAQHVIRWYEAGGAIAGIAALTLLDEPLQRWVRGQRSSTTDAIAGVFRHGGQPEVYATVTLGVLATGILSRKPAVTRAGARAATALALAAAGELAVKPLLGRARPFSTLGAFHYKPFNGSYSMPSGHTTLAFALAASLADDVRSPLLRVGLYGAALGTGLSRVNDDRHWFSDVAAGAVIGITAAKLVRGRWRLFGLEPPRFLMIGAAEAAVVWRADFRLH